jgi:hypothetical protein
VKYLSEGEDGYDTLEWLARQPWCDGRIGTMGPSYSAHTQMAAACLNPPSLACMVLDSGGFSNAYLSGIRQGGAFELKQATWAWKESQSAVGPLARRAIAAEDLHAWFRAMPWSEGRSPLRHAPEYEAYLLEQWRHGTFDDDWRRCGIFAEGWYDTMPPIPVALMSSWYDPYVRTTLDNFEGLGRHRERPLSLVMGPWTHLDRERTVFGDVDFGPQSTFDGNVDTSWLDYRLRFFERWLRGSAGQEGPRVRLFLMGGGSGRRTAAGHLDHGGCWISATDWPPQGGEQRAFYLTMDGQLTAQAPEKPGALSYDFDPRAPTPTIGGAIANGEPIMLSGAFDQRESERFFGSRAPGMPLSARPDVLAFETAPLEQDLAVIGPVQVELWVSTDRPDTDFTAKLIDVHPPTDDDPAGFAMNLTDGIVRCRYRKGWDRPEPVPDGEPFRIVIEPFATANLFKAGHRIRVDISSSNFPKFDVNPNTGGAEAMERIANIARNTVHCGATHASRILLHVHTAHDLAILET